MYPVRRLFVHADCHWDKTSFSLAKTSCRCVTQAMTAAGQPRRSFMMISTPTSRQLWNYAGTQAASTENMAF
jgi:hypothetical protein